MNPTRRSLLATGAGLATATGLGLLCTPAVAAPRATPDTLARLVHPSRKYLGLALQGAPESVTDSSSHPGVNHALIAYTASPLLAFHTART